MYSIIALISLLTITSAQFFGGGMANGGHPIRDFLFSRLMEHLPANAQGKAQAIHEDKSMNPMQKMMAFHGLIQELPADQRPTPPFIDRLPEPFKSKVMAIHNNDSLGMFDKMAAIKSLLSQAPESVKAQLPGGGRFLERLGSGGGPFARLFGGSQ
ncbi:unnamed protein product, partial [Mesorhabditis belari]|uniref:Uncharacterized protein n=1 Tax=Mesorhabditis belari TaxID=2138241 RepID=A0AAF3JBV8_9BILA